MGLIKAIGDEAKDILGAAKGGIKGVFKDKYRDIIKCPDLSDDIMMMRRTTETGRISRTSAIIVQPSQMAVIVDSGRVVDATAEQGMYIFDESSTPSFFAGDFKSSLKDMWERFTFGGASPNEQAVYYFNMKEIMNNGFGTKTPIPFKDWDHAVMNARMPGAYMAMSLNIRCFGKYTFEIDNPAVFMEEIAGTADILKKEEFIEQMRTEVMAAFQSVLNSLGSDKYRIGALDLPGHTALIKQIMDENVFDQPIRNRGLRLVSFAVESVTPDEASQEKINKWELGGDAFNQQAVLTDAYGKAMVEAAGNENGAMNGFMGLGFLNMNTGGMVQNVPGNTANMQAAAQSNMTGVYCPNCKASVSGKFCSNCGTQMPEQNPGKRFCGECGTEVTGKFCQNCGKQV